MTSTNTQMLDEVEVYVELRHRGMESHMARRAARELRTRDMTSTSVWHGFTTPGLDRDILEAALSSIGLSVAMFGEVARGTPYRSRNTA
jgi:glycosyltransferase A (GT-A) superfamily protein (DUF2064 family)